MRRLIPIICCLALGGCALLSGPVTGQLENGSETFSGSVSEKISGKGTLALKTSTGATCDGVFLQNLYGKADEISAAQGIMKCSDGRTGTFEIVGNLGHGTLGGQQITLTVE